MDGEEQGVVPADTGLRGKILNGGDAGQDGGIKVLDEGQQAFGTAVEARVPGHGHHDVLTGLGPQDGFDILGRHGVLHGLCKAAQGVGDALRPHDQVRRLAGLLCGQGQRAGVPHAQA